MLNYTNIQYKASIQSVWLRMPTENLSFSLPWSNINWSDGADVIGMHMMSENEIE